MTNRLSFLGLASLCVVFSPLARAADTSLNPDRWVHLDLQAGGTYDLPRTPDVTSKGINYPRDVTGHSSNVTLSFLVPLNNYWSVSIDGGLSTSLAAASETPVTNGTNTDSPSMTGSLSGRYYFVHQSLRASEPSQNPDRWPSAALTISGADTIYDEITETSPANTTLRTNDFSQSITFTGDTRLPLSDTMTGLFSLAGIFAASNTAETINTQGTDQQGTQRRNNSLSADIGMRYYFVGKNCIRHDAKKNPDEWTSLSLVGTGTTSIDDQQILTAKGKPPDERNIDVKSGSGTLELRLPMTNSMTLRFGLSGGASRTLIPQTALNSGSTTFQPTIGGYIGIRGYFL